MPENKLLLILNRLLGSSRINLGAVFLGISTVVFLLFLTPAWGSNNAGQSLILG